MNASSPAVRIGVIGIGNMGRIHARHILDGKVPGLRLAAVSDSDAGRLEAFAPVACFIDWRALISSGEVDAVLIATPHLSHVPIGEAALAAGLHVLMEKPLAVQKSECERLLNFPRRPEQVFAMMLNQRGDPAYRKIHQLLRSYELGRVQRIQWTVTDWFRPASYYNSSGWRATWAGEGGGILINQCPHHLDLYQWLFGMPSKVRGFCAFGRYHDIEVEDEFTAWFQHPGGTTGVFVASTGEAPGVNRLEIAADRGRLMLENRALSFYRNEVLTSEFSRSTRESFSRPDFWRVEIPLPDGSGEQHVGILKNFSDAIREGVPLIAPLEEGICSVELSNAILMSSVLEETVDLPFPAERFSAVLARLVEDSRKKNNRPEETVSAAPSSA